MKIDNTTYYNVKDIDNVGFFGEVFLDYPHFDSVLVTQAEYNGVQLDEEDLLELNNDRALVQLLCLNYISAICPLDDVY